MALTNPVGPYPPLSPTVSGTLLTVDAFLKAPLQVQKTLQDLTRQRFLADRLFSAGGTATGGAVIYDQILGNDLYTTADVQAITPGSEFPLLEELGPAPLVAKTTKWGGSIQVTYEERDRDRRDVVNRKLTKLRNTIVKKVDVVSLAVLKAAPILTSAASALWSTVSTPIQKDVSTAQMLVDQQDMGYTLTDAYVSPATMNSMVNNDKVTQAIQTFNNGGIQNPLGQTPTEPRLRGFLGLDWHVTNRVLDTEAILVGGQMAGSLSDEKPLYTRVVDLPHRETVLIMGARLCVPYVTDPKSVVRITGVG